MARVVVLENAIIDALAADSSARAEFAGCLSPVLTAAAKSKCGSCRRAGAKNHAAYASAKRCLAQMDAAGRNRLKGLLRADQVKVYVKMGDGGVETLVF